MQAYTIIIIPTLIKCKCLFTMMSNNKHLSLVTCHANMKSLRPKTKMLTF